MRHTRTSPVTHAAALPHEAAEAFMAAYFLFLAAACAALVIGVAVARRRSGRLAGITPAGSLDDAYEAAFLAGGPGRVADAALAALQEAGHVGIAHPGVVGVAPGAFARHPVEHAVLATYAAAPSGALNWLRAAVMRAPAVQAIGDALTARGLMVPPDPMRPWRRRAFAFALLCVAVVPLGLILDATVSTGPADPVTPEWTYLLAVPGIVIGVLCSRTARDRATAKGRFALKLHRVRTRKLDLGAAHQVAVRGLRGIQDADLRKEFTTARRTRVGHPPTVPVSASSAHPGPTRRVDR
ncbi:TIGR04222 domain-containing membrane protein [Streptomyces sp. PmtG]